MRHGEDSRAVCHGLDPIERARQVLGAALTVRNAKLRVEATKAAELRWVAGRTVLRRESCEDAEVALRELRIRDPRVGAQRTRRIEAAPERTAVDRVIRCSIEAHTPERFALFVGEDATRAAPIHA